MKFDDKDYTYEKICNDKKKYGDDKLLNYIKEYKHKKENKKNYNIDKYDLFEKWCEPEDDEIEKDYIEIVEDDYVELVNALGVDYEPEPEPDYDDDIYPTKKKQKNKHEELKDEIEPKPKKPKPKSKPQKRVEFGSSGRVIEI